MRRPAEPDPRRPLVPHHRDLRSTRVVWSIGRTDDEFEGELMAKGAAGRLVEWVRPHVPESSDGILTSAGICEGFAGAGASPGVLAFAGFAGLVAGTVAMGAVEYSKLRAERDQQVAQLTAERARLETAPEAELDELTELYVSRGL